MTWNFLLKEPYAYKTFIKFKNKYFTLIFVLPMKNILLGKLENLCTSSQTTEFKVQKASKLININT